MKQYKPSADNWPTQFRPRRLLESRRAFDADRRAPARTRRPSDELDALVQYGQANDDAVTRFEEYLDATANV